MSFRDVLMRRRRWRTQQQGTLQSFSLLGTENIVTKKKDNACLKHALPPTALLLLIEVKPIKFFLLLKRHPCCSQNKQTCTYGQTHTTFDHNQSQRMKWPSQWWWCCCWWWWCRGCSHWDTLADNSALAFFPSLDYFWCLTHTVTCLLVWRTFLPNVSALSTLGKRAPMVVSSIRTTSSCK